MKRLEKRIAELEAEVKDLRKQLLELALRGPAVITVPTPAPAAPIYPYYPPVIVPRTPDFSPYQPIITWGSQTN